MKNKFFIILFMHFLSFVSFAKPAEAAPSTEPGKQAFQAINTEDAKSLKLACEESFQRITRDPLYPAFCKYIAECPPAGKQTIAIKWMENLETKARSMKGPNTSMAECAEVITETCEGFLVVMNAITTPLNPRLGPNSVFSNSESIPLSPKQRDVLQTRHKLAITQRRKNAKEAESSEGTVSDKDTQVVASSSKRSRTDGNRNG